MWFEACEDGEFEWLTEKVLNNRIRAVRTECPDSCALLRQIIDQDQSGIFPDKRGAMYGLTIFHGLIYGGDQPKDYYEKNVLCVGFGLGRREWRGASC